MKLKNKNQTGFSLIELMVSMVIGLLVMSGVFQVFISTKGANKMLLAEAEMQENARFAFSVMTSIVQEAGNFGCQTSNAMSHNSIVNNTDNTFRPERVIEGWEAKNTAFGDVYSTNANSSVSGTNTKHWTTSATGNAQIDSATKSKKYSDVFKVWYTKKQKTNVTGIAAGVLSFNALDIDKGDILAINDCQSVNFAQVCACEEADCAGNDTQANINKGACLTPGNNTFNFPNINIPTTEISVLEAALFFVGKRGTGKKGYQQNMPSLYVRHLDNDATLGNKEEILEGVESLQILYGEDTNNNQSPNYYVNADDISDWNNVVSLKVSLLLRSLNNNVIAGNQNLEFNGALINVEKTHDSKADRYLRRVFTSTIALRNRNIGY